MKKQWNFLTNHGHVLVCLAENDDATLREIAERVGITERTTARIVDDLVEEGVIERSRRGRCNQYEIQFDFPLRHPLEEHRTVGQLIGMVTRSRENNSV